MFRTRVQITGPVGSPWLSTAYFLAPGGGTADQAVAALGSFWNDLRVIMHTSCTITSEAEVADVSPTTGEVTGIESTTPFTLTGTSSADPLPWATQLVIRWRTGNFVGGREIRGRTFVPGLTESSNTSGVPTAATLSTANAAAAALIADANCILLTWSRTHGNDPAVVTGTALGKFGVLRSRRD